MTLNCTFKLDLRLGAVLLLYAVLCDVWFPSQLMFWMSRNALSKRAWRDISKMSCFQEGGKFIRNYGVASVGGGVGWGGLGGVLQLIHQLS